MKTFDVSFVALYMSILVIFYSYCQTTFSTQPSTCYDDLVSKVTLRGKSKTANVPLWYDA